MAWLFLPDDSVKLKDLLFSKQPFFYSNKVVEFLVPFRGTRQGGTQRIRSDLVHRSRLVYVSSDVSNVLKILYIKVGRYRYHHPLQLRPCCFLMFLASNHKMASSTLKKLSFLI